jgi:branched-chain amino acid transport system permease protein
MWGVANRWVSLRHAYDGIPGVRAPDVAGLRFQDPGNFYLVLLVVFAVCVGLMLLLSRSHFGLALRGVRASPARMAAIGYPVDRLRYAAFVVAGALSSLSGIFFAYHTGYVNISVFDIQRSVWVLLVSILGGVEAFAGPLVGVTVVVFLESWIGQITARHAMVIGVLFMLTILLAPEGIVGKLKAIRERRATQRGAGAP